MLNSSLPTTQLIETPRELHVVHVEAGKSEARYWRDAWEYRELLYFLAWRDILVRYKQTVIGMAWAVIRPLVTVLIFTFVFGRLAKLESPGLPYPLLVCAGMLPWQLFASSVSESSASLVANANLVSKVYFPRVLVPLSALGVALADTLIFLVILVAMAFYYGVGIRPTFILVFPLLLLGTASGAGFGLWLAALNVKYRDFRYVIPFVLQFGLYISPVGFSSTVVPERYRLVYSLNPMVGVIDGFRAAMTGTGDMPWHSLGISFAVAVLLVVSGALYFRSTERGFADYI